MAKIIKNGETILYDPVYFGRMDNATVSAKVKGPCGDEMEFYLVIEKHVIKEAKYYTEGCPITKACGAMAAILATGKHVEKALSISARQILKKLEGVPENHKHCSILAVTTLYKAIAEYLCKEGGYFYKDKTYC